MEDVLVAYLTMRVRLKRPFTEQQALAVLAQERKRTLGALLKDAKSAGILAGNLAEAFEVLSERNWLIHRSMHEYSDGLYQDAQRETAIARARSLTDRSIRLKKAIFEETKQWLAAEGVDVQKAKTMGVAAFHCLREAGRRKS